MATKWLGFLKCLNKIRKKQFSDKRLKDLKYAFLITSSFAPECTITDMYPVSWEAMP
jgi:hypothetical protein